MPILTARQPVGDANLIARLPAEFPVPAQSSDGDKLSFLKARDIMGGFGPYRYAEIGSYLGGSLAPFLRDPLCEAVLSIDDRGRHQPDERGTTYDYTAITHQTMLDTLTRHGLPTDKIETFDGSVSEYPVTEARYDLLLIDGEHTDQACFRDFIHGEKLLKPDAVVMFHDTILILKAIEIIQEYLRAKGRRFVFFKVRGCAVSFILLDGYCDTGFADLFTPEPDMAAFARRASRTMLKYTLEHRTRVPRFLINRLVRKA